MAHHRFIVPGSPDAEADVVGESGVFKVGSPLEHLFRSLPPPTLVAPIVELGGFPKAEGTVSARVATAIMRRAPNPSSRGVMIAIAATVVALACSSGVVYLLFGR